MQSIKTNFQLPVGSDPIKQAARMSQDLSSNFKAINDALKTAGLNLDLACLVPIGSIIYSPLTLAQLQDQSNKGWAAANGADCKGSTYWKITGNTTLPNNVTTTITPSGTVVNVFIKIN